MSNWAVYPIARAAHLKDDGNLGNQSHFAQNGTSHLNQKKAPEFPEAFYSYTAKLQKIRVFSNG
jgi:hypothetical protein